LYLASGRRLAMPVSKGMVRPKRELRGYDDEGAVAGGSGAGGLDSTPVLGTSEASAILMSVLKLLILGAGKGVSLSLLVSRLIHEEAKWLYGDGGAKRLPRRAQLG
jgi:hypothetical protein